MRSAPGSDFACRIPRDDLLDHRVNRVDHAADVTLGVEGDFDKVVRNRNGWVAMVSARIVFVNTERGAELFGKERPN